MDRYQCCRVYRRRAAVRFDHGDATYEIYRNPDDGYCSADGHWTQAETHPDRGICEAPVFDTEQQNH